MNTRNQSRQASGHPSASRDARPSPPDVRQVITDRIIALLEQGVPAFRQRWTRAASRGLPRNGLTGAPYHGANVLVLWDAAIEDGYASHVWLTYKQAERLGAQVRRGEHGVLGAHFERRVRPGTGEPTGGDTGVPDVCEAGTATEDGASAPTILLCRPFRVFNAAQIDGLPAAVLDRCVAPPSAPHGPVERAVRLLGGSGATIRHGFERAMYLPRLDEIRLPGRGSSPAPRTISPRRCTSWCTGRVTRSGCTAPSARASVTRPMPSRSWWPSSAAPSPWGTVAWWRRRWRAMRPTWRLGCGCCGTTARPSSRPHVSRERRSSSSARARCRCWKRCLMCRPSHLCRHLLRRGIDAPVHPCSYPPSTSKKTSCSTFLPRPRANGCGPTAWRSRRMPGQHPAALGELDPFDGDQATGRAMRGWGARSPPGCA